MATVNNINQIHQDIIHSTPLSAQYKDLFKMTLQPPGQMYLWLISWVCECDVSVA